MASTPQRKLTQGEIQLARAAFGDKIAYGDVRISDGPGQNFAAHIAFARGNPAITLGTTVYFKSDHSTDFSKVGADAKSFMHEMTHIWQFQELGQVHFYLRYGKELAEAGFDPDEMYKYKAGTARFEDAMLEAQASMVGDYSAALWAKKPERIALLAGNMAGSGLYGL